MKDKQKAQKISGAKSELEQVNKAISAIISGGQSYGIGSRNVHKADLAVLYKRKDALEDLIGALEGGSGRFRRVIPVN